MAMVRAPNNDVIRKAFRYDQYFRGRKGARKSKPEQGAITLKKRKLDDHVSISSSSSCKKPKVCNSRPKVVKICRCNRGRNVIPESVSVNGYENLNVISQGAYGVVYRAQRNSTGEIVAMKEEFNGLSRTSLTEIEILKSLIPHPSIVGFKGVAVDDCDGVYVVMEHVGNDLKRYIASRTDHFTMLEVKLLMKQLLEGVKFLHENHVMHRDIKPSNILVNSKGELKICDFGLSCRFRNGDGSYSTRVVGTLAYMAPEVVMGKYWCAIDMWSVGCVMGELVLKEVLFKGRKEDDIDQFGVDDLLTRKLWLLLNEEGFDLLQRLLTCDPANRITAQDALNHAWFNE